MSILFLSTPSLRRATGPSSSMALHTGIFLSTPSLRRATWPGAGWRCSGADFYPRPPCGGRHGVAAVSQRDAGFLSTPSLRRATPPAGFARPALLYFYPRPPCGGRQHFLVVRYRNFLISIHALLAEGDRFGGLFDQPFEISIHALLAEGDRNLVEAAVPRPIFLSTPSLRRATAKVYKNRFHFCIKTSKIFFYSHKLCRSSKRTIQKHLDLPVVSGANLPVDF